MIRLIVKVNEEVYDAIEDYADSQNMSISEAFEELVYDALFEPADEDEGDEREEED